MFRQESSSFASIGFLSSSPSFKTVQSRPPRTNHTERALPSIQALSRSASFVLSLSPGPLTVCIPSPDPSGTTRCVENHVSYPRTSAPSPRHDSASMGWRDTRVLSKVYRPTEDHPQPGPTRTPPLFDKSLPPGSDRLAASDCCVLSPGTAKGSIVLMYICFLFHYRGGK